MGNLIVFSHCILIKCSSLNLKVCYQWVHNSYSDWNLELTLLIATIGGINMIKDLNLDIFFTQITIYFLLVFNQFCLSQLPPPSNCFSALIRPSWESVSNTYSTWCISQRQVMAETHSQQQQWDMESCWNC